MGQFSWIAQDTQRSISNLTPQPVTMTDNKGNKWHEANYEGYGVFGGKDYYQLLAEMNEAEGLTGDVDHDRGIGINIAFGKKPHIAPNLNEDPNIPWKNEIPDSCEDQGWVTYDNNGNVVDWDEDEYLDEDEEW